MHHLDVTQEGDITFCSFVDSKILDEAKVQQIGSELFALIDQDDVTKLVMDMHRIQFINSSMLGRLTMLENKSRKLAKPLVFCGIRPEVYDIFAITKLNLVYQIVPTIDEARQAIESDILGKFVCVTADCKNSIELRHNARLASLASIQVTCLACETEIELLVRSQRKRRKCEFSKLRMPASEDGRVDVDVTMAFAQLMVVGKLDLLVSDVVQTAWKTIDGFPVVLINLEGCSEITDKACSELTGLIDSRPKCAVFMVVPENITAFDGWKAESLESSTATSKLIRRFFSSSKEALSECREFVKSNGVKSKPLTAKLA